MTQWLSPEDICEQVMMKIGSEEDLALFLRKRDKPVAVQGGGTRRILACRGRGAGHLGADRGADL